MEEERGRGTHASLFFSSMGREKNSADWEKREATSEGGIPWFLR